MFGIHDFALFVTAGLLLNLTPGQDTLYIVGRTLAQGRRIGVACALGVGTGCLLHALAAALGLSAVLATSPSAFLAVKLAGVAYLIYLGARLLLTRTRRENASDTNAVLHFAAAFRQGVLTNATNPKVALFFLAFLPQFIDPGSAYKLAAFLLLGATFVFTGTLWCLLLALTAGTLRQVWSPSAATGVLLERICGALFIALGVRLAVGEL